MVDIRLMSTDTHNHNMSTFSDNYPMSVYVDSPMAWLLG